MFRHPIAVASLGQSSSSSISGVISSSSSTRLAVSTAKQVTIRRLLNNRTTIVLQNELQLRHLILGTSSPILHMSSTFREEKDTMGVVKVPIDRLFGAQTQRSRDNFRTGAGQNWDAEQMPKPIIYAFAILKKACAWVNQANGDLDGKLSKAIEQACDDVLQERINLKDEFPLVIWQPGSGTQSNMNCNEVIANRAAEILGGKRGSFCSPKRSCQQVSIVERHLPNCDDY